MGIQIVLNKGDLVSFRKMDIGQVTQDMGVRPTVVLGNIRLQQNPRFEPPIRSITTSADHPFQFVALIA